MNRLILTLFAGLTVLISATGCSKKDIVTNQNDILGSWAVTGITSNQPYDWNGDGYTETDIYNSYDYCQRDIVMVFDQGGNGQVRQGCDAQWESLYWQLSNSNQTLNINLPGDDINLNLIQFTSNTIRGEDNVYVNGRNYIITYTLSRR